MASFSSDITGGGMHLLSFRNSLRRFDAANVSHSLATLNNGCTNEKDYRSIGERLGLLAGMSK